MIRGRSALPTLALLAALAAPAAALAQGSPGPMSAAHADLTAFPVDCNRCHEAGFGVPDEKCLACHTHQPLRARIKGDKGFHAADEVKQKRCRDCHAEHQEETPGSGKGRRTTVDWRPFGGQRNFNHRLTGWPLEGSHRFQACEKCHVGRYPATKLTTYLGLRGECTTCHSGTKEAPGPGGHDPHGFTDGALTDCKTCHGFDNWRVPNLGATRFDHDRTRYPLAGKHLAKKCVGCHEDLRTFRVERDFSDCKGCHEDAHRSVISAKRACASCHDQKVEFPKTTFDHAREAGWPLRGQHAKNRCKACHEIGSRPEAPEPRCAGCHEDVHQGRFGKETCEGCHVDLGWKQVTYAHDAKTRFPLTGKHQTTRCVDCHRFGIGPAFERFQSTACADCHRHQQAHCGQFGTENCERCHVRGGDRTSKFDHGLTRFPLERAHAEVDCARCHPVARLGDGPACRQAVKYTGLDPSCGACHADVHRGELGKDCVKCHTSGESFKTLVFDHNRDARFDLTGFHQLVECAECHPGRRYKLEDVTCAGCHGDEDVHAGALGKDCGRCHETTGGAPKFDHALHTRFPTEGVHARIECERCHYLDPDGTSPFGAPAPTTGSAAPRSADRQSAVAHAIEGRSVVAAMLASAPARALALLGLGAAEPAPTAKLAPGRPLDLRFRAAGVACEDCHPDPHQVRPGLDCASCHGLEGWKATTRNDYHEPAGFALDGAHSVVACSLCHDGVRDLSGRGERCGACHAQDDVHAGSLGADCGRCHEQRGWLPTTFTHVDTGLVLEGVHRTLDCRQCHQQGAYFIDDRCFSCHLKDYRGSQFHQIDGVLNRGRPTHGVNGGTEPGASLDCGACHNQFSFHLGVYGAPRTDGTR